MRNHNPATGAPFWAARALGVLLVMAVLTVLTLACGSDQTTGTATTGGPTTSDAGAGGDSTPPDTAAGPSATAPEATATTTPPSSTSAPDPTGGGTIVTGTTTTTGPITGPGEGIVAVNIEEVGGVFIEGFEVGLRFETAAGQTIATTLWTDFVLGLDGEPTMDSWYDSVLTQPVPAGDVVVLGTVNVGTGPGPEIPDVNGNLRCRLEVSVPDGGRVNVEVTFADPDRCLVLS
jgi:hypothetical protein